MTRLTYRLSAIASLCVLWAGWGEPASAQNLSRQAQTQQEEPSPQSRRQRVQIEAPRFSYWDEHAVELVKSEIAENNPYFTGHYQTLIAEADALLGFAPDPVVNKTVLPPSGDKHDYLSIAPYFWPNPDTSDGLPWVARDGQINPMTRGPDTDQLRHSKMIGALITLNLAYALSEDQKYGAKIAEILRIWYLDPATRVNPHVDFGQGIPGGLTGRPIGVIEWTPIRYMVTSVELVREGGFLSTDEQLSMQRWLTRYTDWLLHSPIGKAEDVQPQNHGTWYDVQALTLLIHLGRYEEAQARAQAAKQNRIAVQIRPDGSMPHENRRTKSVNYNSMNRDGMAHIARLSAIVGVDLIGFQTKDGSSLVKSLHHLVPFATGKVEWPHKQIEYGGQWPAIQKRMQPVLLRTGDTFCLDLLPTDLQREVAGRLSSRDALAYPPHIMLTDRAGSAGVAIADGVSCNKGIN